MHDHKEAHLDPGRSATRTPWMPALTLVVLLALGFLANGFAEVLGRYLGVSAPDPENRSLQDFVQTGWSDHLLRTWLTPLDIALVYAPTWVAFVAWRGWPCVRLVLWVLTAGLTAFEVGEVIAWHATDLNGNDVCLLAAFGHAAMGWVALALAAVARTVWRLVG